MYSNVSSGRSSSTKLAGTVIGLASALTLKNLREIDRLHALHRYAIPTSLSLNLRTSSKRGMEIAVMLVLVRQWGRES